MYYYSRNIGDYHKKAGRLTMLQHGAYTLLMDAIYDRELFPTLENAIDWTWASNQPEIDAVTFVLNKFFVLDDGVYIQARIQDEIQHYQGVCLTNAINGKKGGRPKKTTESKANQTQSVNNKTQSVNIKSESKANESDLKPNQEPITNNHKPITNKPTTTKKSKTYKYDPVHYQLAVELSNPVIQRHPSQKINLDEWAEAIRKLITIDGHTASQIRSLWQFRTDHVGNNGFTWADNCRTPMKLRQSKDGLSYFEIIKTQLMREQGHGQNQHSGNSGSNRKPSLVERVEANCRKLQQERESGTIIENDGGFVAQNDQPIRP